jgi:SAM-dependent methyltransferase
MPRMQNDQRRFFDETSASVYDETILRTDAEAAVAFLTRFARGGPALELAIGTGRIALPLTRQGIRVDGIDLSPAMVDHLRAKPGGDELAVTIGDMADVRVDGSYRLIYVVANSLTNVGTQDGQVRCFENVAAHLRDDGVFVVDSYLPEPDWLRDGHYVRAEHVGADEVRLDVSRIDRVAQVLDENHVVLTDGGVRLSPVVTRYIWPSEMDLMARIAGLQLKERWSGWNGEPFTGAAGSFVSVYAR